MPGYVLRHAATCTAPMEMASAGRARLTVIMNASGHQPVVQSLPPGLSQWSRTPLQDSSIKAVGAMTQRRQCQGIHLSERRTAAKERDHLALILLGEQRTGSVDQ